MVIPKNAFNKKDNIYTGEALQIKKRHANITISRGIMKKQIKHLEARS